MRATSLVLIGVSQIHVVLNILINRNYSYCNTMYKWINKRFCLSVCLSKHYLPPKKKTYTSFEGVEVKRFVQIATKVMCGNLNKVCPCFE